MRKHWNQRSLLKPSGDLDTRDNILTARICFLFRCLLVAEQAYLLGYISHRLPFLECYYQNALGAKKVESILISIYYLVENAFICGWSLHYKFSK